MRARTGLQGMRVRRARPPTPAGLAVVVAATLTVILAGCVGGPATHERDDGVAAGHELGLTATKTTGILRGLVVDEAIRPLDGVEVVVHGPRVASTGTGSDGAFGLDGLPPGNYLVAASKPGYVPAQAQVAVEAAVAEPPAIKLQLVADAAARPYSTIQAFDGLIECTTNVIVLCGAPNTVEQQLLCPALGVCPGPLTNDRFTFTLHYPNRPLMVQSELVWSSTQELSPELGLELEALNNDPACPEVDALAGETGGLNSTQGPSPIAVRVHEEGLLAWEIGGPCGIFHSIFAGTVAEGPVGASIQQRFTLVSHSFHGYLPPESWTFAHDGPPPPPA